MKAPHKGGDFTPAPEGSHAARVYQLIDIGMQHSEAYGDKHQIILSYELVDELMEDGRPFVLSKFYTLSLHEKATLCIDLEGIAGKKMDEATKDAFDFRKVLNAPCMVSVIHEKKTGEIKAKIKTVSALPKGMKASPLKNPQVFFDLEAPDWSILEALPDWLKGKVNTKGAKTASEAPFDDDSDDIPFN